MADRGVIFSAPMVRALIKGRKTETRRLATNRNFARIRCGDRLWVRESFCDLRATHGTSFYRATDNPEDECIFDYRWSSPIHMPREDSRLTLTVTKVFRQNLAAMKNRDAVAEGAFQPYASRPGCWSMVDCGATHRTPLEAFMAYWDSLNPENPAIDCPVVTAVKFTVALRNIDI